MDFGIKAARAALLVGVLGLLVPGAYAQDQATEDAAELGDITVTGSRIRRPAVEGPTPVVVITREDIANQGFGSIQDVFDSVVQKYLRQRCPDSDFRLYAGRLVSPAQGLLFGLHAGADRRPSAARLPAGSGRR